MSAAPGAFDVYVGTYTGGESRGIYHLRLDLATGQLSPARLVAETPNPSFLALHPSGSYLYAVNETSDFGGEKSGSVSAFTVDGDYLRIVNPYNGTSPQDTEDRNANWTNDEVIETLLFPQGSFKSETQSGLDASCSTLQPAPVVGGSTLTGCFESRGLGPQAGVRAQFVQSVFIGEPPENVDLETYCTLCRS